MISGGAFWCLTVQLTNTTSGPTLSAQSGVQCTMLRAWHIVLLVLFLGSGCAGAEEAQHGPTDLPRGQKEPTEVLLYKADFDGDRKQDSVWGERTAVPNAYRTIIVKSATARRLMSVSEPSFFYETLVAQPGSPYPVLIVGSPFGNWLKISGFMYSPATKRMEPLKWDEDEYVVGRGVHIDPTTSDIVMWTERGKVSFRFEQGLALLHNASLP